MKTQTRYIRHCFLNAEVFEDWCCLMTANKLWRKFLAKFWIRNPRELYTGSHANHEEYRKHVNQESTGRPGSQRQTSGHQDELIKIPRPAQNSARTGLRVPLYTIPGRDILHGRAGTRRPPTGA